MPGTINAPTYGEPVPDNDVPYKIVKTNRIKKSEDKRPKPLDESSKKEDK